MTVNGTRVAQLIDRGGRLLIATAGDRCGQSGEVVYER